LSVIEECENPTLARILLKREIQRTNSDKHQVLKLAEKLHCDDLIENLFKNMYSMKGM